MWPSWTDAARVQDPDTRWLILEAPALGCVGREGGQLWALRAAQLPHGGLTVTMLPTPAPGSLPQPDGSSWAWARDAVLSSDPPP